MSQETAVLFANEAFYLAFSGADIDAMADLWAERTAVSCIHPGWSPLFGRVEVLDSWHDILSAAETPEIVCSHACAMITGDVAYVVCYENFERGALVATNIFAREAGRWRMVHHQAAPAPPPEAPEIPDHTPTTLQ